MLVADAVIQPVDQALWVTDFKRHSESSPREFDPAGTHFVAAHWIVGIGCTTSAPTVDTLHRLSSRRSHCAPR